MAGTVGFIQGFVAFATTVGLSRKLADIIMAKAREPYDPSGSGLQPRVSDWIAQAICFAALALMHFVVLEVCLSALSEQNPVVRAHLGRIWIFALVGGIAVSRLLPEIESKIRSARRKQ